MTNLTPPSASTDNEQENELSKGIYEYLRWQLVALRRNFRLTGMTDEYITAKARYLSNEINERIAHHTQEAVEAAQIHEVQEVRRWIRASGMAPDFEKRLTAVAGYLDRRLTELFSGQSKGGGDTRQRDGDE